MLLRVVESYSRVRIWDALTGSLLQTLEGDADAVSFVAWSPDGTKLATGGDVPFGPDGKRLATGRDPAVGIWDASTGKLLRTLNGHTDSIRSVAWSPDGTRIASGARDNTTRIWDAVGDSLLLTLTGHSASVEGVAWNPDGTRLVSGSDDWTVRIWNVPRLVGAPTPAPTATPGPAASAQPVAPSTSTSVATIIPTSVTPPPSPEGPPIPSRALIALALIAVTVVGALLYRARTARRRPLAAPAAVSAPTSGEPTWREIESALTDLLTSDPRIYVEDVRGLIQRGRREGRAEPIEGASRLLAEKRRLLEERRKAEAERKNLEERENSLAMQLADGKIGEDAYKWAADQLQFSKRELHEKIGQIDAKLYKEEYEKPAL